jgi:DNA polymerase III delta prime subunit
MKLMVCLLVIVVVLASLLPFAEKQTYVPPPMLNAGTDSLQIPIICICNERKLPKMKPFDMVTFDLPFRRPEANAVRSRVMSIAYREGLKIPPNVIDQLVEGTHADIRQIINMLSTYSTTQSSMNFDQSKDLFVNLVPSNFPLLTFV